jgi:beta-xylosidase
VECWSSTDMETWAYEGVVWSPPSPDGWNNTLIWAPHMLVWEGCYYLYYAANQMIGVAVADSPTGPFLDVYDRPLIGGGYCGTPGLSIDADVFADEDGSLYMYCTDNDPYSVIRVSPMSDPVTVACDWTTLFYPGLVFETFWAEGPWMVRHEGRYYLMYSGGSTALPYYAVGYYLADNPLGPFEKFEGNPILHVDWEYDFWGPGHHSTVVGPDGALWIFYHTKIAPSYGWERELRKNKLDFDTEGNMYVVLYDDDSTDDDSTVDDTGDDCLDDDASDNDSEAVNDDDSTDGSAQVPASSADDDAENQSGCGCS